MSLAWRLARRELRSGVAGFRVFLACLALGVAAIAAAGSTAEAFRQGLATQAREILGGDLAVSVDQRRFTPAERAAFQRLGRTALAVRANAMAEAPGGRRLIDLRGVGTTYPLAGRVELKGAPDLETALRPEGGAFGAVAEQTLLDRLGLKLGDRFTAGRAVFVLRGVLVAEPDRIGRGFALGPRVLTRVEAVEQADVLEPGAFFGETVRVALPPGADAKTAIADLRRRFPNAGFEARDRSEAAAGAGRLVDQLEYFLGFVGLASLAAGGLGVAGAVSAHLEGRRPSIATLKALGASGALVRNVYLQQTAVLAVFGVAVGAAVGAAAPFLLGALVGDRLPVPALFALYPEPLLRAAAFGLLTAAAFSLAPLARARATPPSSLFRRELTTRVRFGPEVAGALIAAVAAAALAVLTAPTPAAAFGLIGGTVVAFALLWALGRGAIWAAARLRGSTRGVLRLGLGNLAGPRSAARGATPAIGLGVALLSAVVLIQSGLVTQIRDVAPRTAPSVVFTEIPAGRTAEFDRIVSAAMARPGADRYLRAPVLSGRVTRLKSRPVDVKAIDERERWAYDQDLVLSAVDGPQRGSKVAEGAWWPVGYRGPPLVAMEVKAARGAGLKVGDTITLQVLGREIDARVAVLREVDFGGFGANFAYVLNTAAIEGANPRHVAIARATRAEEAALTAALAGEFREVNVISVREQLEQASQLFERLTLAVRGAAAVAGLAGVLVLAGAVAAGARARVREAALLKVLGGSRRQILTAYLVEYGLVGLIAGAAGVALGAAAAWPVLVLVFEATWSVNGAEVAALLSGTTALGLAAGTIAALHALSRRPGPVLREG